MSYKMKGWGGFQSPAKQKLEKKLQGPIPESNMGLQPGENPDTWVYKGKNKNERIIDLEERAGYLAHNDLFDSDWYIGGASQSDFEAAKWSPYHKDKIKKATIKGAKKRKVMEQTVKNLDHEAQLLRDRSE